MEQYLTKLSSLGEQVLSEPIVALVLSAALLFLLHRHNILSYGSHIHETTSWIMMALLMTSQVGIATRSLSLMVIATIILVFLSEYIITSIAQHKSPFIGFNIGLGIGLLSMIDPIWLPTLLIFGFMLRQIGLGTWRHYSAMVLGVLMVLWVGILLLAPPTPEGVLGFIDRTYGSLLHPSLPSSTDDWLRVSSLLMLLTAATIETMIVRRHAIARYRWVTHLHLRLGWFLFVVYCIYYSAEMPSPVLSLFFCISCVTAFLCTNTRRLVFLTSVLGSITGFTLYAFLSPLF